MGVPLLLTWLRRRFAGCFAPASSNNNAAAAAGVTDPDNLYVDLNSFLYQAAAVVESHAQSGAVAPQSTEEVEELVLQQLFVLLDDVVLHLVRPRRLVYLAMDGISPLGKLAQQRSRRHRHAARQHRFASRSLPMDSLWDSNCISVGTRFMLKAAQALHHYAVSRTESINMQRLRSATTATATATATDFEPMVPIAILVDDVLRPGEGETKISEAIRAFRTSPQYNPNTSHVICSTDTDVTVTSLLLHEPRIHVLRYEPPSSSGPQQRHRAANAADAWQSTFFSLHHFREELRRLLGMLPTEGGIPDPSSALSADFERALHDIVFLLLLFGNDFLPSVSGSIQEGTLDALLTLLAEDFVPRQRCIVDAATNHINFDAARYLLTRLFEIRQELRQERLAIITDVNGDANGGDGLPRRPPLGNTDWGFEDEPAHQQRREEQERTTRTRCYCYWTMLQWALHYSAGDVKHWGCYYPFRTAPPLDKLALYCGEVSYAALRRFASRRAHTKEAANNNNNNNNKEEEEEEEEEDGVTLEAVDDASLRIGERGQPTDVLVQLLVLLPPQSKSLLPPFLQDAYEEVAPLVNARMEHIDFDRILAWCEEKKKYLTEAERTRFRAYQFFAQDKHILKAAAASAVEEHQTEGRSLTRIRTPQPPQEKEKEEEEEELGLLARNIVFLACWSAEAVEAEQRHEWNRAVEAATQQAAMGSSGQEVMPAMASTAASFFMSAARGTGGTSSISAAAAALKALAEARPVATEKTNAPTLRPPPSPVTTPRPEEKEKEEEVAAPTRFDTPSFSLLVGPIALLGEDLLQRAVGRLEGGRLVTAHYTPGTLRTAPLLTRDVATGRTRLRWQLAVTRDDSSHHRRGAAEGGAPQQQQQQQHLVGLLPGVVMPAEAPWRERLREQPASMPLPPMKRLREADLDKEMKAMMGGDGETDAMPILQTAAEAEAEAIATKREALRRQIEALKATASQAREARIEEIDTALDQLRADFVPSLLLSFSSLTFLCFVYENKRKTFNNNNNKTHRALNCARCVVFHPHTILRAIERMRTAGSGSIMVHPRLAYQVFEPSGGSIPVAHSAARLVCLHGLLGSSRNFGAICRTLAAGSMSRTQPDLPARHLHGPPSLAGRLLRTDTGPREGGCRREGEEGLAHPIAAAAHPSVAYDCRNHGDSFHHPFMSLDDLADDLQQFLCYIVSQESSSSLCASSSSSSSSQIARQTLGRRRSGSGPGVDADGGPVVLVRHTGPVQLYSPDAEPPSCVDASPWGSLAHPPPGDTPVPLILVGHSMGGVTALHWIWREHLLHHHRCQQHALPLSLPLVPPPCFANQFYRIVGAVIIDVGPTARPLVFSDTMRRLRFLREIPVEQLHSLAAVEQWVCSNGPPDLFHPGALWQVRYYLSNLVFEPGGPARWRINLDAILNHLDHLVWCDGGPRVVVKALQQTGLCRRRFDTFPLLFLFGEHSPYNHPRAHQSIAAHFSQPVTLEVLGADHFLHIHQRKTFCRLVSNFVDLAMQMEREKTAHH
eukprot:gene6540-4715_t